MEILSEGDFVNELLILVGGMVEVLRPGGPLPQGYQTLIKALTQHKNPYFGGMVEVLRPGAGGPAPQSSQSLTRAPTQQNNP